jgi:hypothetical protein
MSHVFVETNWVHGYAAPAHHRVPDAVALLERAGKGEFTLQIPNASFMEGRQSILSKCQPTDTAGVHRYIRWAQNIGELNDGQATDAHQLAERYEQSIKKELKAVSITLQRIADLPSIRVFAFDDEMLDLANQLALTDTAKKPFDQAILAGVLVSSSRLWKKGERGISFAELDSDLQPWGQRGAPKDDLRKLYDDAHVWVYGDFTLQFPPRPSDFE